MSGQPIPMPNPADFRNPATGATSPLYFEALEIWERAVKKWEKLPRSLPPMPDPKDFDILGYARQDVSSFGNFLLSTLHGFRCNATYVLALQTWARIVDKTAQ